MSWWDNRKVTLVPASDDPKHVEEWSRMAERLKLIPVSDDNPDINDDISPVIRIGSVGGTFSVGGTVVDDPCAATGGLVHVHVGPIKIVQKPRVSDVPPYPISSSIRQSIRQSISPAVPSVPPMTTTTTDTVETINVKSLDGPHLFYQSNGMVRSSVYADESYVICVPCSDNDGEYFIAMINSGLIAGDQFKSLQPVMEGPNGLDNGNCIKDYTVRKGGIITSLGFETKGGVRRLNATVALALGKPVNVDGAVHIGKISV